MEKKKSVKLYFLLGAALGLISFLAIYGVNVLDVTNDSWLLTGQDLQQHYTGWMFFRKAAWTFPLGMHNGVTYPYAISILYTDSIPLFALVFKALSPVLPQTFQYFGIFGLLCFILNGGFASVILTKFSENKLVVGVCTMFFILSAPVLQRLYGLTTETTRHTSLAAHFLILGAIAIWVYKERFDKLWKAALVWSILGVSCVLIQMYIIFMVGGIMCGYLLHCMLEKRDVKRIFFVLSSFALCSIIAMYVIGGFSSGVSAGMGGFGEFSANINALFNPYHYSRVLPNLPMMENQYEGFSYLGLGMLILLVVVIIYTVKKLFTWHRNKCLKLKIKEHYQLRRSFYVPVIIEVIVFGVLALSSIVYLNKHFLISVTFPDKVEELLGVFRSSGRFMWCVMYFIMFACIAFVLKKFKKRFAYVLLTLCVCLQIFDLSGALGRIHNTFACEVTKPKLEKDMPSEFWKNIPEKYTQIKFFPMSLYTDETVEQYLNVGAVAAKNNMTLNYFYLSRPYNTILEKGNKEMEKSFQNGSAEDHVIYILDIYRSHTFADKLNLYIVDNIIVGTKDPLPGLSPYVDVIMSEKNRSYLLNINPSTKIKPVLSRGWLDIEEDGVWTEKRGIVSVLTDQIRYLHVKVTYTQNPESGESRLYLNGEKVATIPENGPGTLEFDMDLLRLRGKLSNKKVQMHVLNIYTPKAVKVNKKKTQGIKIHSIEFTVTDNIR